MTGPEHYRAAEQLLAGVVGLVDVAREAAANGATMAELQVGVAYIQITAQQAATHAQLANAAAIVAGLDSTDLSWFARTDAGTIA